MTQNNPYLEIDRRMVGDIYTSSELMDNLKILCDDFGSRFGGTPGEKQAADFFKAKMEAYGLSNVHLEAFSYIGWTRGPAKFEILEPVYKEIDCISLPHSPAATLEGVIVDLGDGDPADFDRRSEEIKDKILMTTSVVNPGSAKRWVHRGEKYGRSLLAGASGFIFVNHYPGFGPATGGIGHDGEGLIPAISICKEDGDFIRRLAARMGTIKVRITTSDHSEPMTSWNVIGDLPGALDPAQYVMLGCHYDGHDISQGAGDPASGAVAVLEAARVLAQHATADSVSPLPCTVRFILWGVEEIGLLGSRQYVQQHKDELDRIRFYLNMDAAGSANNGRDIALNEWPQLGGLFRRYKEEMAADFLVGQSLHAFSDHFPFFMEGVPTGGIESVRRSLEGRGYGHTRYDTVDKVDQVGLREAAALAARIALRTAGEENWPVEKRTTQAVASLLDSPDYREERSLRKKVDDLYEKVR